MQGLSYETFFKDEKYLQQRLENDGVDDMRDGLNELHCDVLCRAERIGFLYAEFYCADVQKEYFAYRIN